MEREIITFYYTVLCCCLRLISQSLSDSQHSLVSSYQPTPRFNISSSGKFTHATYSELEWSGCILQLLIGRSFFCFCDECLIIACMVMTRMLALIEACKNIIVSLTCPLPPPLYQTSQPATEVCREMCVWSIVVSEPDPRKIEK